MGGGGFLFLLIWSFLFCGLPVIILYEFFLLVTKEKEIVHPFISCLLLSFTISIILIVLMLRDSTVTGESGLAGMIMLPLTLIFSLLIGTLVALFYKVRNKPILPRKPPKDDKQPVNLSFLIKQNDIQSIQTLFDQDSPSEKEIKNALWMATTLGKPALVRLLIEKGADPNSLNEKGQTCLWRAIYNIDARTLGLLLENKARVDLRDINGRTALWELANMSNHSRFNSHDTKTDKALLNIYKNSNSEDRSDQGDLIEKSLTREINIAQILIDNGLDPSIKDNNGQTAFDVALENKNDKLVGFLSNYMN